MTATKPCPDCRRPIVASWTRCAPCAASRAAAREAVRVEEARPNDWAACNACGALRGRHFDGCPIRSAGHPGTSTQGDRSR
jgi:hypothetical protein